MNVLPLITISSLPFIDFIFILLIAVCAIVASLKGFIDEIFDKGAPVLGIIAGFLFYKKISLSLKEYIKIDILSNIVGFLVIFIFVFLIIKIIQQFVSRLFDAKIFRQLNHSLGFLFGIVEGFVLVAIIIFVMKMQPWFDFSEMLSESIFYKLYVWFVSQKPINPEATPDKIPNTISEPLSNT